jgi:hypothetical protein
VRLIRSASCALRRDALSRSRLAYSALLACALVPRACPSVRPPAAGPSSRAPSCCSPPVKAARAAALLSRAAAGRAAASARYAAREVHSAATCAGVMCDGSELLARSAATKEKAPLPHCADGQSRTDALQVKSISEFFGLRCAPVVLDCRCQQEQDTLLGVLRLVHRTLASSQCYAPVRCTGVLVCVVRYAATHPDGTEDREGAVMLEDASSPRSIGACVRACVCAFVRA